MSALRLVKQSSLSLSSLLIFVQGADLATIFCTEAAGVPIKSFSPELMVRDCMRLCVECVCAQVHPVLRQSGRDLDPRILAGDA